MKLLFNCSTNNIGGGVKNSILFIKQALNDDSVEWVFAVSDEIYRQLKHQNLIDGRIHHFKVSPARNTASREALKRLEKEHNVSLVYTMAGPAYVKFNAPHILGCSNGYVTHGDWEAYSINKNPIKTGLLILQVIYQALMMRKADFWVFQTETSRLGFVKRLFVSKSKTFVVKNSYDQTFEKSFSPVKHPIEEARIFVPSAPFNHKKLELIPFVSESLKKKGIKHRFILTVKDDHPKWQQIKQMSNRLNVGSSITNAGPFGVSEAKSLYDQSDLVFLPSILETFSGVYLEAMLNGRPLVTPDKDFARDICQDSAIYYHSSPQEAADAIELLVNNSDEYNKCVNKGSELSRQYPTSKERFDELMGVIKNLDLSK